MLKEFLAFIDKKLERACYLTLLFFVAIIIFLSALTIFLRWRGLSFLWIDPLVRHLVFACAFLGGTLAVGRREHIGIDLVSKILESKKKEKSLENLQLFLDLASFGVLLWLIFSSLHLVRVEAQAGETVMLGLHSSYLLSIMPVGFSLMAYRYLYHFISCFHERKK